MQKISLNRKRSDELGGGVRVNAMVNLSNALVILLGASGCVLCVALSGCGGSGGGSSNSGGGSAGDSTATAGSSGTTVSESGAAGQRADAGPDSSDSLNRISLGSQFGCAIGNDGGIVCWGSPGLPAEVQPPSGSFSFLSSFNDVSCGIKNDNSVACWGNASGAMATPVPVGLTAVALDIGVSEQCAVNLGSKVVCWGGENATLGTAPSASFVQVGVGLDFACGLERIGTIACWGSNAFGQATAPSGNFVQLTTGKHHSCALRSDGVAVCWGLGDASSPTDGGGTGSSGDGTDSPWGQSIAPTDKKFKKLGAGMIHSCGILTSGDVVCWGAGTIMGDCSSVDNCGQAVSQTGPFSDIALGYTNTCGLLATGKIKCWGSNSNGRSTPPPSFQ